MGVVIWSRFYQAARPAGPYIAHKGEVPVTAPSTFISIPALYDNTYHVRFSCYNSSSGTIGCDQPESEQLFNGFWVYPSEDAMFKFEIIL